MEYNKIKYKTAILIVNRCSRLLGNIMKTLCYPFHALFPKKRFTIPAFSPAKVQSNTPTKINKTIWQTNYTNHVSLPVYLNYLFNRLMSLSYDYRYVSTEERVEFIRENADERMFAAYSKLTDGAAQADFWRLLVLYKQGGIYMDIDGQLVWPLANMIGAEDNEVLVYRKGRYNNYFIACAKGNPILKDTLDLIVDNIEQRRIEHGVYNLTGPVPFNTAIGDRKMSVRPEKLTAIQGSFTNEYFQYIDKKRGKWTHAKKEDLLK
ncbi:Mannosyltransferase OCH1 [Pasteurella testudinis DSM 23072]|uniref:Mannosyltransferase OCH1 n=1 Tax=Pasteurella testudinis DSM 23072 TaxID=1122938 RepID=A0A1W1UAT0_9PAST|nr:glycosyltransferase [Pasteurella testudinis]SMB78195.1 Mannosyltransferase OCH1 [Pasteurella testudinis DSM 23072]SUB52652.1 glycosyltransferase, DXD sugar-binding motif protein [Pasteurella testudinis]